MNLMDMLVGNKDNPNQRSLLGFIGDLPGLLTPGSQGPAPVQGQSELSPDDLANANAMYKRQFRGAQAKAVASGMDQAGVSAAASADAQDSYQNTVQNSLKMAEAIKARRDDSERHARLQALLQSPDYTPKQRDAMGAMTDDQIGEIVGKNAFPAKPTGQPIQVTGGYITPNADGTSWDMHSTGKEKIPAKILDDGSAVIPNEPDENGKVTFQYFQPPFKMGAANIAGMKIDAASANALAKRNTALDPDFIRALSQYKAKPNMRSSDYAAQVAAATRLNPAYDATKYDEKVKAMRDFGTGALGTQAVAANNVIEHLDTLNDLSDALGNGTFTPGNALSNEVSTMFGGTAPTDFEGVKHIVSAEIAKVIVPGGKSAESDRDAFAQQAALAKSPAQLSSIINKVQRLLATQVKNAGAQYKRTTGYDDFGATFLSPRTRQVIDSFPDGSAAKADTPKPAVTKSGVPVINWNH